MSALQQMVTSLHHVNVTVPPELEIATKHFYGEVVGLKQVPKPATARQSGAWYQIGENQLHLSVEDEESAPLSSRHVCFHVSDLAEAENKFRDAGVPSNRVTSSLATRSPGVVPLKTRSVYW